MSSYDYFVIFGIVQLIHSQEEIWNDFHKKWFVFKMPLAVFLAFEATLSAAILAYIVNPHLPGASIFMSWFMFLMFINGAEHIFWAAVAKKYVPGLITAPIFIILFGFYYSSLL